jgi:hypothetical protein
MAGEDVRRESAFPLALPQVPSCRSAAARIPLDCRRRQGRSDKPRSALMEHDDVRGFPASGTCDGARARFCGKGDAANLAGGTGDRHPGVRARSSRTVATRIGTLPVGPSASPGVGPSHVRSYDPAGPKLGVNVLRNGEAMPAVARAD